MLLFTGIKEKPTDPKWHHWCEKSMMPNLDLIPDLIAILASHRSVILSTTLGPLGAP